MRIDGFQPIPKPDSSPASGPAPEGGFAGRLRHYLAELNAEHKAAEAASVELALGRSKNTAETLLAVQKADLSFQLMLSVRNKLVDAYREVMRMQV